MIAEKGSGAANKEMFNQIRESMMERAIAKIKTYRPVEVLEKIRGFQHESKVDRQMAKLGRTIAAAQERKGAALSQADVHELRCHKCNSFAALSTDVRRVVGTLRVILDEHYRDRIVIEPHPKPVRHEKYESTGKIFCTRCHSEWGIMAVYKKVPFPVIRIHNFVVYDARQKRTLYKHWKDVMFPVADLTPDDLLKMLEALRTSDSGSLDVDIAEDLSSLSVSEAGSTTGDDPMNDSNSLSEDDE